MEKLNEIMSYIDHFVDHLNAGNSELEEIHKLITYSLKKKEEGSQTISEVSTTQEVEEKKELQDIDKILAMARRIRVNQPSTESSAAGGKLESDPAPGEKLSKVQSSRAASVGRNKPKEGPKLVKSTSIPIKRSKDSESQPKNQQKTKSHLDKSIPSRQTAISTSSQPKSASSPIVINQNLIQSTPQLQTDENYQKGTAFINSADDIERSIRRILSVDTQKNELYQRVKLNRQRYLQMCESIHPICSNRVLKWAPNTTSSDVEHIEREIRGYLELWTSLGVPLSSQEHITEQFNQVYDELLYQQYLVIYS